MMDQQDDRKNYMPTLDGVRAVACLLVLISHVIYMNANGIAAEGIYHLSAQLGTAGVEIFFALSGFLIGALYIDQDFSCRNVGHYAIARFARIVPCYYIALTVALLFSIVIPGFQYAMDPTTLAWSYSFIKSIHIFWTVPPEVQFYTFFLLLWAGYDRMRHGKYILLIAALFTALFIIVHRALWSELVTTQILHVFLAGIATSLALRHPRVRTISQHILFQLSTIVFFVLGVVCLPNPDKAFANIPFGIVTAVMVMTLSHSTYLTGVLKTHTFRMIGAASFSIYLFHDMFLQVFKAWGVFDGKGLAVMIIMQVVIALGGPMLFYVGIERVLNKGLRTGLMRLFDSALAFTKNKEVNPSKN